MDNEEYDYDEQNMQNDQIDNRSSRTQSGVKNKVKQGVSKAGKKAAKSIGKVIGEAMKKLFVALVTNPYFWIVVAVLAFLIIVVFLLGELASSTYTDSVDKYVKGITNTELKGMYEQKKSLIYFTLDDINKIYDSFVNDKEGDLSTIEDMKKKFKNGNPGNDGITISSGAVSVNDEREIYKHILLTEKYNFNNIKWTEYSHDGSEKNAKLKVDSKMGMQYPDDSSRSIDSFISMTMPYLQSWYIPLSMYSASGTSNNLTSNGATVKNAEFAYQIIAKAYSNISINKYNKQTYTKKTDRYEYEDTNYDYWEKLDDKGNVVDSGYNVTKSNGTIPEAKVSETTETNTEYALVEAKTFDVVEKNSYEYTPYNVNDEPDFEEELDEPYNQTITRGKSYTIRTGKRYIKTRVWNDKLIPQSQSVKSTYTVADIESYIGGFQNRSSKEYYLQFESDGKIDKLDFLNAKPDIFGNYIDTKSAYDKNVGFTKSYLTFSYGILTDLLRDIGKDSGGYPYIYGQSLGIIGTNFSVNTVSGMWDSAENLVIDPNISLILPFDIKYKGYISDTVISTNPWVYGYAGHSGIDTAPNHDQFTDESKYFTSIKFSSVSMNPYMKGPAVYAPCDGTLVGVQYSACNKYHSTGDPNSIIPYGGSSGLGSGATVVIKDSSGNRYILTHLFPNKSLFDSLGARMNGPIKKGEYVGNMGNTGKSTGPHLHYEVVPVGKEMWGKNGLATYTAIQTALNSQK